MNTPPRVARQLQWNSPPRANANTSMQIGAPNNANVNMTQYNNTGNVIMRTGVPNAPATPPRISAQGFATPTLGYATPRGLATPRLATPRQNGTPVPAMRAPAPRMGINNRHRRQPPALVRDPVITDPDLLETRTLGEFVEDGPGWMEQNGKRKLIPNATGYGTRRSRKARKTRKARKSRKSRW